MSKQVVSAEALASWLAKKEAACRLRAARCQDSADDRNEWLHEAAYFRAAHALAIGGTFAVNAQLLLALKSLVTHLSDHDDEGLIEHAEQMQAAREAIAASVYPLAAAGEGKAG